MSDAQPVYVSHVRIVRERGPIRQAFLPAEEKPVTFGTHGSVREHYGTAPGSIPSTPLRSITSSRPLPVDSPAPWVARWRRVGSTPLTET